MVAFFCFAHLFLFVNTLYSFLLQQVRLNAEEDAKLFNFNSRIHNIIDAIRSTRALYPQLTVIREGDRIEEVFRWRLVEDPANFAGGNVSYSDYAQMVGAR